MRTIKFRACIESEEIMIQHREVMERAHLKFDDSLNSSDKVMQFTGLTDKNGKEIYEGDIITGALPTKKSIIGWSKKFASFCIRTDGWMFEHWFGATCDPENCEVIGNIHENPELLKEQL